MTLKEWRTMKGWTQAEVAEALKKHLEGPWRQSHVADWEKSVEPRAAVAEAIRKLTGGKVKGDSFGRKSGKEG